VPERVRRRPALLETVRVVAGRAPLWPLHLARLERSAFALGIALPADIVPPAGGADRICRFEFGGRGRVRVTERGIERPMGITLRTAGVPHRGYRHKTTDREWLDAARLDAASQGADDVLLLTEGGFAAESSVWSLFWWEGGRLAAPPLAFGILPGVARARLGELAGGLMESATPARELAGLGAFLANAGRGIVPILAIDGELVVPNEETAPLTAAFWP